VGNLGLQPLFSAPDTRISWQMHQTPVDYYEVLQISANAETETIQRVYRLLAQRFHPDNQTTGDADRFRLIHEAYTVLISPDRRAEHDAMLASFHEGPWQPASEAQWVEHDFEFEQNARMSILEVLYTRRRREPRQPGLYDLELEQLLDVPREHLEFTLWFLSEKGFVRRAVDSSRLTITAEGVEYLEHNLKPLTRRRLGSGLRVAAEPEPAARAS